MNLAELTTEFLARGFDYLSTSRAENYLNSGYLLDICEEEDWPFLEATKEGTAPLEIPDLRAIQYVIDKTQDIPLQPIDPRNLTGEINADLTTVGTPTTYYLTGGTTINVFQANTTDQLLVRYWKVPTRLSGTESPLVPERFHSLIVDAAVARAYEDSDDYELAQNAWTNFERRAQAMRTSLGTQHRDGPDGYIELTDLDRSV